MAFEITPGVFPVMITPWKEDNTPDFKTIEALTDWYIEKGCDGIFAICQSSEMMYLSEQEKLDIARCVAETAAGRIQIVASGHTACDTVTQYREIENMMKIPGIGAYVLVSNRLDIKKEGETALRKCVDDIFRTFPEISFGIYECPAPWKRLLTTEFLHDYASSGQLVFLKDTCCDFELIHERIDAVRGTPLKIYNANCQSWYDTLCYGAAGYSGVMANFHPDLYKYCVTHKDSDPEKAKLVADFLCMAGMIERTCYPVSCKYYHQLNGVKMSTYCRSADRSNLLNAAKEEVWSLISLENHIRAMIAG